MSPAVPKTQAEWRTAYAALYDQKIKAEGTMRALAKEMATLRKLLRQATGRPRRRQR